MVLYFYPKDDTPGCTTESCAFQDNLPKFKKSKAAVLGVSVLDSKSKAKFAEKYGLKFPLLADADHAVIEKYGVWQEKSMYGKKYMGVARTTYLIGPDGKVAKRWDGVKVDGHAEEVLAAVQAALSIRLARQSRAWTAPTKRRWSATRSPGPASSRSISIWSAAASTSPSIPIAFPPRRSSTRLAATGLAAHTHARRRSSSATITRTTITITTPRNGGRSRAA